MILVATGAILLLLGLFAGALLVAAPLGLVAATPGIMLWVFFPLFSVVGYTLFVIGGRDRSVRVWSMLMSILLLLLALACAAGLVLQAAGMVPGSPGGTLALWYVLLVAGLVGAVGAASLGQAKEAAGA